LEIINGQLETRKTEIEEKMRQLEEEIKKLCTENGSLKTTKGQSVATTPTVSFAEMLKRDTTKIPEKTRLIESNKRNSRPTIVIKPKEGENLKDARMRLTRTVSR